MSTVADLVRSSLRLIGIIDPNEPLTAGQVQDGIEVLNDILEAWNIDSLMVYTINRNVFPFVNGQQSYTLGSGGDFDMPRPTRIENVSSLLTQNSPEVEIPVTLIQDEDWQGIAVKNVNSGFPLYVYPDGGFPLNTLNFWPIPVQQCSCVLYTWNLLTAFTAADDEIAFPPGYRKALRYALACELAPEYGAEVSPTVRLEASNIKNWLRNLNRTPMSMTFDSVLTSNRSTTVGIRSFGYVVDP